MYNILLVEDSPDFQLLIEKTLSKISNEFTICGSYQEASAAMKQKSFDAILLDVTLPDGDGFSLCNELQSSAKTSNTPVFFATGKNDPADIIAAFSMGAEDIISKPFDPSVLRARVEARLNKIKSLKKQDEVLVIDDLHINLPNMKAYLVVDQKQQDLMLTPTEFKLLYHLAKSVEQVFSRDQIIASVWGTNVKIFDRNVDVQLSSLRRKLGRYGECIQSVPGAGYRFSRSNRDRALSGSV